MARAEDSRAPVGEAPNLLIIRQAGFAGRGPVASAPGRGPLRGTALRA